MSTTFQKHFFAQHPQAASVIALFDFLPDAYFYAKNHESRFVRVNHAMCGLYDVADESEVIGRTDFDFHAPSLAEAYRAEDRRVMARGVALPNQLWLVPHLRGMPRWYISSKIPLQDTEGKVIGIAGVMYRVQTPEEQSRWFGELQPVLEHLEKHYSEDISMEAMAELAGMSSTHFNRRFQQVLHMSPSGYLLSRRVQEAQRLLANTEESIAAIGLAVGFYDQSHFTRRFRKETGLTPRAYRKRFRA